MPETRIEWALLTIGLVALALLGVLIAVTLRDDAATSAATNVTPMQKPAVAPPPPFRRSPPRPAPPVTRSTPTAPTPAGGSATKSPAEQPPPAAAAIRLRLTAARGDSWLEVRSSSSAGRVLFFGTFTRGTTRVFRGTRLWVRFGGASNLDARLNGRPVGLRFGTYDTLVTADGLTPSS